MSNVSHAGRANVASSSSTFLLTYQLRSRPAFVLFRRRTLPSRRDWFRPRLRVKTPHSSPRGFGETRFASSEVT